jgi:exosome complex exonuclease DIS3/RRP44
MAQYASRSSVNLHTHIFFRNRKRDETGYILFVRQNAMQVLIPKYGLEGTLFLRTTTDKDDKDKENKVNFVFDEAVPSQTCGDVSFKLFMEVKVQMSLDSSNVQHEKLMLRLVEPKVEGFSVEPAEEEGEKAKDAGDESKVGVGKEAVKRSLAQEDGGGGKKKGKKMKKGK